MLDERPRRAASARSCARRCSASGATLRERADHDVLDADAGRHAADAAAAREGGRAARHERLGQPLRRVRRGSTLEPAPTWDSRPGAYLALLSHSGSRGPGAMIADHYTKLARALHPELPKELSLPGLARARLRAGAGVLGRDEPDGRLRRREPRGDPRATSPSHLGATVLAGVENHHNFAWKERARRARGRSCTARARRRPARACSA